MSSEFLSKDLVYVNSNNRSQGNSHDFIIDLSQQIKPNNDYDSICLLNFTCPKSYYLIDELNNRFTVLEGLNSTLITIPSGNYDFLTLRATMQTLLQVCNFTYAVSANQVSGKYEFSVSNNASQPYFIFTNDSPNKTIGFEIDTYQFSANALTAPNIVNFQRTNTIELCSDIVKKSIFASIIQNSPDFSNITYTEFNASLSSQSLIKNNVNAVRFYLLDGNTGKPLLLNGLNFSFTFCIYKKNNYYEHMLQDAKTQATIDAIETEIRNLEDKVINIAGR
jgi:hypothetical protein